MEFTELASPQANLFAYTYPEVVLNILVASGLGFVISFLYRTTHKGLSYSQSFTLTVLFVTVIVAVVMMVIGGSLARAFALVGALSIIRFRTVIKDTKDTTYVFLALAVGMAAGTSNYFLAFVGTGMIGFLIVIVDYYNYGALQKSDFVVRFLYQQGDGEAAYLDSFDRYTRTSHLLHIEPTGDAEMVRLTFNVSLKEDVDASDFVKAVGEVPGIEDMVLIAAKNDVDY